MLPIEERYQGAMLLIRCLQVILAALSGYGVGEWLFFHDIYSLRASIASGVIAAVVSFVIVVMATRIYLRRATR